MPVNPGTFRHLVTIKGPVVGASDGAGGWAAGTPVVIAEDAWASIEALNGSEQLRAMKETAEATHRITLREWWPGITAAMWVEFEGRTFHIVAPPTDADQRRAQIELLAREDT